MKVVSPYRPAPAVSIEHQRLGPFDWCGALTCLRESVRRACACETYTLTTADSRVPGPALRYETSQSSLMVWILEVCLRFIESDDFNDDTVMASPDLLVFQDLRPWMDADLGLIVRPGRKYEQRPILNIVQLWRVAAKDRLIAFYREALRLAEALPESSKIWGADTEPLVELVSPILLGYVRRAGLHVRLIDQADFVHELSKRDEAALDCGEIPPPAQRPIVDFKYLRKRHLRRYFEATIGAAVVS